MPKDCYLSIIVPVLNEAESLTELCQRLVVAARSITVRYEIIFVDDGSSDSSFEILSELHRTNENICVIQMRRNQGKAIALAIGFRQAVGQFVVTIDADLQDQPEEIPQIVETLNQGNDLVCTWRVNRHDTWAKKLASRLFNVVTSWAGGITLHDANCGLKGFRRSVVENLNMRGELHRFIPLVAHWQGYKVVEIKVEHSARRHGVSKYGRERIIRGFLDLLTIMMLTRFVGRPLHLFGGLGMLMTTLGLGLNLYLAIGWLLNKWWLTDRPLLLLGVLLMITGLQFLLFGLLAETVAHSRENFADADIKQRILPRNGT